MKTINHPPRLARLRLALLLCLFGSAMAVQAGTYYFLGNGNGTGARAWTNSINWTLAASGGVGGVFPVWTALDNDLVFGNYILPPGETQLRADNGGNQLGLNGNNANAHSLTFTCNGWLMQVKAATDKIILGAGGITNNLNNVGGLTNGTQAAVGPNQFRNYLELSASATIWNYDTNQQLTIRQDAAQFGAGNMYCLDLKNFTLTFDGPGTNNFNTITAGTHAGGALKGTGGLIKNGAGATTFGATNGYTGSTVINAGLLGVRSMCNGGGTYTVADGATFQVTMNSPITSLNVSSLNVTSTSTNSLLLGMTSSTSVGNPTAPIIHATNLTLNGTIYVSLTGSGLSPGTIPLIQYDNPIAGGGTLVTNTIPSGVVAYLTNNTTAKQFQLVVSQVPSLVWVGKTNSTLAGNWDIGVTTNWVDSSSALPANFANGLPVKFDDTGFTNLVTLVTNVTPFSLTVSNNAKTYTLTNDGILGFQANPSGGLIKDGPGLFNLGTTNSYTSFTAIKQGTLRTTIANAIGRGIGQSGATLTNNGTLDLNGFSQNIGPLNGSGVITNSSSSSVILQSQAGAVDGGSYAGRIDEGTSGGTITFNKSGGTLTLSGNNNYSGGTHFITGGAAASRTIILGGDHALGTGPLYFDILSTLTADASPRSLTNSIIVQNINASINLGSSGAGLLTCSGPININSATDQNLVFASDVVFSGPFSSTSGGLQTKDGPGTLRLKNNTVTSINLANDSRVSDGTLIIDGATVSIIGATLPNFRVQSLVTNGTAYLLITNNGSLTVGNVNGYARLRLGDTTSAPGSTNIADIRGTLIADAVTMGYSNTNNAGGGALARLNLQSGSQVTLNQISPPSTNCRAITEVNLDGATINAFDTASSSFLQGMTNVFIKSGGVTLNGSNTNSIHIRQNLLSGGGSGGLTWNGTNSAVPTATTLQLDGASTYTGTTLINVGSLGGIGTLASPLVMIGGSSLLPGGGGNIGTFTVNNNVTLNSGVHGSFELNTTNYLLNATTTNEFGAITNYVLLATNDMLVVSGTLIVSGATLTVNNDGTNLVLGSYFKLFNQAAVGFTSVNLPALDAGLAWQNNLAVDGSIQVVVAVVTPPPLNFSQAGNVLTFTWTNASFHLQSQTNTLGVGLSTNWSDHPGGGASGVGVTNDPANPTVFFRLKNP